MNEWHGFFGLVWKNSVQIPVECSITTSRKSSWSNAIQLFDSNCDSPFGLRSKGYDKEWDGKKKRDWLKKQGAIVVPITIVVGLENGPLSENHQ